MNAVICDRCGATMKKTTHAYASVSIFYPQWGEECPGPIPVKPDGLVLELCSSCEHDVRAFLEKNLEDANGLLEEQAESQDPEKQRGLNGRKYNVVRSDGSSAAYSSSTPRQPPGKHAGCEYFVLDLMHDKFWAPALSVYADRCAADFPLLAADIRTKIQLAGPDGLLIQAAERKEKP